MRRGHPIQGDHHPCQKPTRHRIAGGLDDSSSLTGLAAGAVAFFAGPAGAQATTPEDVQVNLDNVFVLLAAVLVIFMQAGFALVEAGLTRAEERRQHHDEEPDGLLRRRRRVPRRRLRHRVRRRLDGFGKFFGAEGFFLGDGAFAVRHPDTVPVFFMFQVAFAATAATIVSGAMAERTKFKSLPHLQRRHQPDHLPGRRALAVGRRLARTSSTRRSTTSPARPSST